ncbi:NurA domain-containing protein [Deferribacter autotrophicus]|uniref:NurA domain-containing protein n=1 Tax=Deferribacter autotrophicus TaxID=500465 RepID=A0A5A8F2G6_9BACT|nr:DNA double-strand break repair nuclease NurA [Deferribacter autotrophicus]KAA0257558.1 NurA domain-containing protein [Deferribacter autotrophicus]
MGYTGRRRPNQWASKASHTFLIKDNDVRTFLEKCSFPKEKDEISIDNKYIYETIEITDNPIKLIIAVDGGYNEANVKKKFPSASLAFFQFGALSFSVEDLRNLSHDPFIFPEQIAKLKELERIKLVIPVRNITYYEQTTLTDSIRKAIYDFFMVPRDAFSFMDVLYWLVFEIYNTDKVEFYNLASHPNKNSDAKNIKLFRDKMNKDFTFEHEDGKIYLTDIFRLHEAIDDELGAHGILGYITGLIEQIIIAYYIKFIYEKKPDLLNEILFIKDGPLAFFGQTANMHKPFRKLFNYLSKKYNVFIVGLEKSGPFVEHAIELCDTTNGKPILERGKYLLLSNKHIYKYILPGDPEDEKPYARTSYYSAKLIFHSKNGYIYVLTIPVEDENIVLDPQKENFKNIDIILNNLEYLKCDMYDNSLIPVALVNQLVSIADHPSSVLLEKFSKREIK